MDHGKSSLMAALAALPNLLLAGATTPDMLIDDMIVTLKAHEIAMEPVPCYTDDNKRTHRGHIKKSERWR